MNTLKNPETLTFDEFMAWTEEQNIQIDYADAYGEPGYPEPESGILFANWNKVRTDIQDRLEELGYELEWSDEWFVASSSAPSKAYRTSADSYVWQPYYICNDWTNGEVIGGDEIEADQDEGGLAERYILEFLMDNPDACNLFSIDDCLARLGFKEIDETYESGFHPGQNDDPHTIGATLTEHGREYVFTLGGVGQFDTRFTVYTRARQ